MHEGALHRARIVSSVAATAISLACGTNYVYSAWAPQFADKLQLTATQSNLIGLSGNLGMYSLGVPVGIFIDTRGPRPAVLSGSLLLGLGYFLLRQAFVVGSGSLVAMCVYAYLTGLGGSMAFSSAIKTSALNWPHHRGTATAVPLAAFGLSAFFFSVVGSLAFPGDTGAFLLLLAVGTFGLTTTGFFFLRDWPHASAHSHTAYDVLPDDDTAAEGGPAAPRKKGSAGRSRSTISEDPDIRGWALMASTEFWQLFSIMGILAGIGLMTINNIGHDANALWKHYDDSVDESFLVHRQQMHVSILSIGSFTGRLLSGTGSDFLVKRLQASRVWCLVFASVVFSIAQILALTIVNPHFLAFVSSLSGVGYGFLMGVFPSIVAESFGIHGLSQNWGFMTMAPTISGNIFNLFYGTIFDHHSVVGPDGERTCPDGLLCYRAAYLVTLGACGLGLVVTLLVIRHQHLQRLKEMGKRSLED